MTLAELESGFFGYKKASVYQYITNLEKEFSAKLVERDEEMKKAVEQYQQKIQQLEEELSKVRAQYEAQQEAQSVISSALIQAQRYADVIKHEAEQEQREAQRRFEAATAEQTRELDGYCSQIRNLRESFAAMLREMDDTMDQLEQQAERILEEKPEPKLTLFSRKTEPVA